MIITLIGASGLAKDLIDIFRYENYIRGIALFDNISDVKEKKLYNQFDIITSIDELKKRFIEVSPFFVTAIGSPRKRKEINQQLEAIGGYNFSYICSQSLISQYSTIAEKGVIIQMNCQISSDVIIEEGVFLNVRCMIGHDVKIGKYTTLSPDVKLLGNADIGENCVLATGVTVMPNVKIGNNVKIGMNKLVTEDVPDGTMLI
ncbi:MAG: acetyltransferase [Crocinitomicaceae bacterium]|nr:acetyltransferase [Crocinitomicaceae bacterium]